MRPMLADDLKPAIGPAMTLLFEGIERIGQQTVTIAPIGIVNLPATFEDREAEVGIFDDGVTRPATGCVERVAPDEAHRAMHNDGVGLVALDHADIEEPCVFSVHRLVHDRALAVAMILRSLDHADLRIGKNGGEVFQPIGPNHIVGINDADDFGVSGRMGECQPERTGLESWHVVLVDELEAFAEFPAVALDRLPILRIRRVVDDDNALKIRIFEMRNSVERLLEHFRRFAIGRNVNRDFRVEAFRERRVWTNQPLWRTAEQDCRDFFNAGKRNENQRNKKQDAETQRKGSAPDQVVRVPEREDDGEPGSDRIGCRGKNNCLPDRGARLCDRCQREQQAKQNCKSADFPVFGVADRTRPGKLHLARCIEQAPIGADAAFAGFPRLIDCLNDVVVDTTSVGAGDEVTDDLRLLDAAGYSSMTIVSGARPAELCDDDSFEWIGAANVFIALDGFIYRLTGRVFVPIGQYVNRDIIDRGRQFWYLIGYWVRTVWEPSIMSLAGSNRDRALALDLLDDLNEFVDCLVATQDRFVSHHDGIDVSVAFCEFDSLFNFAFVFFDILLLVLVDRPVFVLVLLIAQPDTDRDLEAELGRNCGNKLFPIRRRIGTDCTRIRAQQPQVRPDLLRSCAVAIFRVLRTAIRIV